MERIVPVLNKYLSNVTSIGESIYSADLNFEDQSIARYFVDCSGKIANTDTEPGTYIEKFHSDLITPEYFSEGGSIQWNYYLIFVAEEIPSDLREKVEKEKSYTRKFVIAPENLDEFLGFQKGIGEKVDDIAAIWKQKLDENGLEPVYLEDKKFTYKAVVPQYLSGESFGTMSSGTQESNKNEREEGDILQIDAIRLLKEYRRYPVQREFRFGKVNLIRGINGSGKTSLLEAIEFGFCGQTLRNPKENLKNPGIQIRFAGFDEYEDVSIGKRGRYRARDGKWYGHGEYAGKKTEGLQKRFNRFNFFDTDAAYKLSVGGDKVNIREALAKLIAGPEVNRIAERVQGFHQRFESKLTSLRKEEKALQDSRNSSKEDLERIEGIEEIASRSFENLRQLAQDFDFAEDFPAKVSEGFERFEKKRMVIKGLLDEIQTVMPENNNPVLAEIEAQLKEQKRAFEKEESLRSSTSNLNEEARKTGLRKRELEEKRNLLSQAKEHYSVPNIELIVGLKEKIRMLSKKNNRLESIVEKWNEIDISEIASSRDSFGLLIDRDESRLAEAKKSKSEAEKRFSRLKSSLDELRKIQVEIKEKGRRFLTLNPLVGNCPLCDSDLGTELLSQRILKTVAEVENSLEIETISNEIEEFLKEIHSIDHSLSEIRNLEKVVLSISSEFGFEPSDRLWKEYPLFELIPKVDQFLANQESETKQLPDLRSLADTLDSEGLTEESFLSVKSTLAAKFPQLLQLEEISKGINQELESLSQKIESVSVEIEDLRESVSSQTQEAWEFLLSLNLKLDGESLNEVLENLKARNSKLVQVRELIRRLMEILPNRKSPFVSDLRNEMRKVDALYQNYLKEQKELLEGTAIRKKIESELEKTEQDLAEIAPKIKRCRKAVNTLSAILKDHSVDSYLRSFLDDRRQGILEIYKGIHAPKEFGEMRYHDDGIQLYRNAEKEWVDLAAISTGQRAALALSIFLTLNKSLQNGPETIIFDDPVSYVDDLNLLSFLDYLRKLVIHENRQIVFATASDKIANLFEHKFDFLGDEFQVFQLDRPYYS